MSFETARQTVLDLLEATGMATDRALLRRLGPDAAHLAQVRQDLIDSGLALDHQGTGLIYVEPAAVALPEAQTAAPPSSLEKALTDLPSVLAVPLEAYYRDAHPVVKLWHACEAVEMVLRLVVMIGAADLRRQGRFDEALRAKVSPLIDRPTLGAWLRMAQALADRLREPGPPAFAPPLAELVDDALGPLLDNPGQPQTPRKSFTALRNQLAHGASLTRRAAESLVADWGKRFEDAMGRAAWLAEFSVVVFLGPDRYGALRGPTAAAVTFEPAPEALAVLRQLDIRGERVAAVHGPVALPLWPLLLYGVPSVPDPDVPEPPDQPTPQVYVRREGPWLQYTPVGSEDVCRSECSDPVALEAFCELFRPPPAPEAARGRQGADGGFEDEIGRVARQLVGRTRELDTIKEKLAASYDGVLWVAGVAGIGKSYLIARVVADLLACPPANTLVVPYRFKGGDHRCNRDRFLRLSVQRLRAWDGVERAEAAASDDAGHGDRALEGLKALLRGLKAGHRVLFALDGLDEIEELDRGFAQEIPAALAARYHGVTWLCAGRPEQGLPETFAPSASCQPVFPDGLPPMSRAEIRAMLLAQIGPLTAKLLRNDEDRTDQRLFPLPQVRAADLRGLRLPAAVRDVFRGNDVPLAENHVVRRVDAGKAPSWVVVDIDTGAAYTVKDGPGGLWVHGDEVVNPFIDLVARYSEGVPLYVRHVIIDILGARLRHLDEREAADKLPRSLRDYYEELLHRCKVSTLQQVLTPMVTLLAVAEEPLGDEQLSEYLLDRRLLKYAGEATTTVREGVARVRSMLRAGARPGGKPGHMLYHHSLRQHLHDSPTSREAVELSGDWLCDKCSQVPVPEDSFKPYVFRHGVRHLLAAGRYAAAVDLLRHLRDRPDIEPHLPRDFLRQFAKDLSTALKKRRKDLPAEEVRRIDAEGLKALLQDLYEIEPMYGGIRLLVDRAPAGTWPAELDSLIATEDFVILYTIAQALADAYRDDPTPERLAVLKALTEREDVSYHELGAYALKLVYARRPEEPLDAGLLGRLAESPSYADRMILGELLLMLTFQRRPGFDARALVPCASFWEPVWDYHRLDVCDLTAAGYFLRDGDNSLPETVRDEAVRRAYADLERTARLRAGLLVSSPVRDVAVLRELFEGYGTRATDRDRIRAAEDDLGRLLRTPALAEAMRVLFAHPLWDVGEAAASVLSSFAEAEPQAEEIIRELRQDEYWRVRYAAVEAAFAVRFLDQHRLFREAVHACYRDANCRVRGLCAENLMAWLVYSRPPEHRALVEEFKEEILYWVRWGDDCWLLEHVYHLFKALTERAGESGYDCEELLASGVSPLLGEPGERRFYELTRAEFLQRIEGQRARYPAFTDR